MAAGGAQFDTVELPVELTYLPVPFVGVYGLGGGVDARHAVIWQCLTVNRAPDRVPLYYKLFDDANQFPQSKPKVSRRWHQANAVVNCAARAENQLRMAHSERRSQEQVGVQALVRAAGCGRAVRRPRLGRPGLAREECQLRIAIAVNQESVCRPVHRGCACSSSEKFDNCRR